MRATIYLVDDDESVRRAVGRLLRSADMDVLTFDSAEALLAAPLPPSVCLVLDVHLPKVSGLELHRRLPHVPVVFITAVDDEATRQLAAQGKLLLKPFEADRLLEAIQAAIANRPTPKAS